MTNLAAGMWRAGRTAAGAGLGLVDRAATVVVDRAVRLVLDRVDVTSYVLDRVDLQRIVAAVDPDPVVARADLDAVIARIDLVGLTRQVLDVVDLPDIVRESSNSMASEGVVGLRLQGLAADARLERLMDRLRPGRQAPGGAPDGARDDGH